MFLLKTILFLLFILGAALQSAARPKQPAALNEVTLAGNEKINPNILQQLEGMQYVPKSKKNRVNDYLKKRRVIYEPQPLTMPQFYGQMMMPARGVLDNVIDPMEDYLDNEVLPTYEFFRPRIMF